MQWTVSTKNISLSHSAARINFRYNVFLLRSSHNRIQQTVAMKEVFIYFPIVLHHTSLGSNTTGCSKLSAPTKEFQFNFFFVTLHQISLGPNRTGWGKLGTKKSLCRYAALLKPQFRQIQQTVSTKKKTSRHKKFHCLVKGAMTTNASLVHKKDCLVGITLTPLLTWNSLE